MRLSFTDYICVVPDVDIFLKGHVGATFSGTPNTHQCTQDGSEAPFKCSECGIASFASFGSFERENAKTSKRRSKT
jgi:hypothetical protein